MPTCHLVLLALSGCLVQPIVPDTDAEPTPSTPDDTGKPEVDELRLSLTDAEPADGATELAQDAAITLTFDGVLDRAASPTDAVLVSVNDAPAAASIAWREDQLAITPEIRWPLFGEVVVRRASSGTRRGGSTSGYRRSTGSRGLRRPCAGTSVDVAGSWA